MALLSCSEIIIEEFSIFFLFPKFIIFTNFDVIYFVEILKLLLVELGCRRWLAVAAKQNVVILSSLFL